MSFGAKKHVKGRGLVERSPKRLPAMCACSGGFLYSDDLAAFQDTYDSGTLAGGDEDPGDAAGVTDISGEGHCAIFVASGNPHGELNSSQATAGARLH